MNNQLLDDLEALNRLRTKEEDLLKLKKTLLFFFVIAVILSFFGHYAVDSCWYLDPYQGNNLVVGFVFCTMIFIGATYLLLIKKILELLFEPVFIRKFSDISSGSWIVDLLIVFVCGLLAGAMVGIGIIIIYEITKGFFVQIENTIIIFERLLDARWCKLQAIFVMLLGISFMLMYKHGKTEIIDYHKGGAVNLLNKTINESLAKDISKFKKFQLAFLVIGFLLILLEHYIGIHFFPQQEIVIPPPLDPSMPYIESVDTGIQPFFQQLTTIFIIFLLATAYILAMKKLINSLFYPIYISNILPFADEKSFLGWLQTFGAVLIFGAIVLIICIVLMIVLVEVSAASRFLYGLKFEIANCIDAALLIMLIISFVFTEFIKKRDLPFYHERK